jgi:type II secretory pathway component PulC
MKANMMRAPLIKSAAVLLVFSLLAYLTSVSPEGGVLSSVGLIIIGAFRLVQWALAMIIGLTISIAFLIAIFLFAAFLVNKQTAASMYEALKGSIAALCQPLLVRFGSFASKTPQPRPVVQAAVTEPGSAVQTAVTEEQRKEDLQIIIAGEVKKVTDNQQALSVQFSALSNKIEALEEKTAGFAAAGQLEAMAAEISASSKLLENVQENVAALEGKINDTVQQLQTITPERMLGDIPARLEKLEQPNDEPVFDPAPLTASIENLHQEVEALKRKNVGGKTKKKA